MVQKKSIKTENRTTAATPKRGLLDSLARRWPMRVFLLWLAPFSVLVGFFMSEILKEKNYLEIFPKELVFPLLIIVLTALLISIVVYVVPVPKSIGAKVVSSLLLGFLLVGYDDRLNGFAPLIKSLTPLLPDTSNEMPVVSLIFFLILLLATTLIGFIVEKLQNKYLQLNSKNIIAGAVILLVFILAGQSLRIVTILPHMATQSRVLPTPLKSSSSSSDNEHPDIYYIILDRYTNNTVLKEQFNFDNSKFLDFLRSNNFTVNDNAHSNYPYTTMSVSSTLNATYTKEYVEPFKDNAVQSATLYHNLIRQSSVIKSLTENGYRYYNIGSSYGATNKAPLAYIDYMFEHVLVKSSGKEIKRLRGIEANQFRQSIFYRFTTVSGIDWWPVKSVQKDGVGYVRDQINTLKDLAEGTESGGRFIFAHILVPHDPYYFNADGSISSYSGSDDNGLPVKQKYVNQIEFINTQMHDLIADINKKSDGKAVILLNADEGAYPNLMSSTFNNPAGYSDKVVEGVSTNDSMSSWTDDWLTMKYGILQAVHIPEATTDDLQQLSSVNLFRIVLNRYTGANLSYLPDCQFGLTQGKWYGFEYEDLSSRFGNNDTYCKEQATR